MYRRTRRVRKSRGLGIALSLWGLLLVAWVIFSIIHVLGWLIMTGALCGLCYFLGQHRKLDRFLPGRFRARESYWLNGRVRGMDTVSAYPDMPTRKVPGNSRYGKSRDNLLSDPRSGARPLFPEQ